METRRKFDTRKSMIEKSREKLRKDEKMCLNRVYRGQKKKDILAKLPESGYYWKTVMQLEGKYHPICQNTSMPFKIGWNYTKSKSIGLGYQIAFHLNRSKKAAEEWGGRIVRCIVKKKDIVAIGTQFGRLTIVTKRFWIPKPKKKPA